MDRRARTAPAVEARLQTFIAQVPAEITDPAERRARGIALRRAYMQTLTADRAAAQRRKRDETLTKAEQMRSRRERAQRLRALAVVLEAEADDGAS